MNISKKNTQKKSLDLLEEKKSEHDEKKLKLEEQKIELDKAKFEFEKTQAQKRMPRLSAISSIANVALVFVVSVTAIVGQFMYRDIELRKMEDKQSRDREFQEIDFIMRYGKTLRNSSLEEKRMYAQVIKRLSPDVSKTVFDILESNSAPSERIIWQQERAKPDSLQCPIENQQAQIADRIPTVLGAEVNTVTPSYIQDLLGGNSSKKLLSGFTDPLGSFDSSQKYLPSTVSIMEKSPPNWGISDRSIYSLNQKTDIDLSWLTSRSPATVKEIVPTNALYVPAAFGIESAENKSFANSPRSTGDIYSFSVVAGGPTLLSSTSWGVSGKIVDAETGQPISQAAIKIAPPYSLSSTICFTNELGEFETQIPANVSSLPIKISVTHVGHSTIFKEVISIGNSHFNLGTIAMRVRDSNGDQLRTNLEPIKQDQP